MRRGVPLLLPIVLLAFAFQASAAENLTIQVTSRDGCPEAAWFREQLEGRGVRGSVQVSLGAEADGYAGTVEARAEDGRSVTRRLTGPRCTTVAEGLVVVAEVHLTEKEAASPNPPDPPSSPTSSPVSLPPTSAPPTSAPPTSPAPAGPAPLRARFAAGLSGTVDTVVSGDPEFGGGLTLWLSLGRWPMRGLALSAIYSRADVTKVVPVTYQHVRGRLDLLPFDVSLTPSTTLGFGAFLSGGALHAAAVLPVSTPGLRMFWVTGAGVRLRQALPPVFVEAGVDATFSITQRSFEVTGLAGPLFSVPLFGVSAALSLGVPLGD